MKVKLSNRVKIVGGTIGMFLLGLVMIYIPVNASMSLLHALQHHASRINFDKGAYYQFGGGLIFALFPIIVVLGYIFNPGEKATARIMRVMVTFFGVCFVSVFVLPQVMSVSVGHYLEKRGYVYCGNLSHQWLIAKTMVYQKNSCQPEQK